MNINYNSADIARICQGDFLQNPTETNVHAIAYDTRKIHQGQSTLFACLKSTENNGHAFIGSAFEKGVRIFLVDQDVEIKNVEEATFIRVNSVIGALQKWATHHRNLFQIPVIGITGSAGKTVIKEWLYHLLSDNFIVARSPKSFNSQLGVALSIFEINELTEIALIEAGISQENEMMNLAKMIKPTLGVFASFGAAHRENFSSETKQLDEKISLFENCSLVFAPEKYSELLSKNKKFRFSSMGKTLDETNGNLIRLVAENLGLTEEIIAAKLKTLPKIALRMESLDGINQNLLLFDAYNWNLDGLEQALGYQVAVAKGKDRYLVLSDDAFKKMEELAFQKLTEDYSLKRQNVNEKSILLFGTKEVSSISKIHRSVLLFKGAQAELKRLGSRLKFRNHSTFVEINLPALKQNLSVWRARAPKSCKLLAMVKAQSYGSELTKLSYFLTQQGISYLGVAYTDEGVELRKSGVELPIMVMNSDASTWQDCIQYKLEPSVYSFEQMEALVRELIHEGIDQFPVHLKFDTGMHRLGFQLGDLQKVVQYLQAQPELKVESVFSHLSDADNLVDRTFTLKQLKEFQHITEILQKALPYPILRHVLNSEGLGNYPEYCFDMVRLGIGMFGISSNKEVQKTLHEVISWKSTISQIKTVRVGESVGYGNTFVAKKPTQIAIIPVGYADGFRRQLSNGLGGIFVNGDYYPTVGRVCMDMLMVDCTGSNLSVGEEVEIIGKHQSLLSMATRCSTIPYEIMTGLSARMPRVFIEEVD